MISLGCPKRSREEPSQDRYEVVPPILIGLDLDYITQKLWSETLMLSWSPIAQAPYAGLISCTDMQLILF